ncbi:MAG TPA: FeoA family protein [Clostridia bacterium]|nr:FeoA family protein [Clostridia bacterium]
MSMASTLFKDLFKKRGINYSSNTLVDACFNKPYEIRDIRTTEDELKEFLFTLGCYKGEEITLISILSDNYVIVVKDARYSIDKALAKAIIIE